MNRVMLDLGIIQIKWYSFFIFMGIIIAYSVIRKESLKKNLIDEKLTNLIFYGIIIGMIGARIYYVLFNLDYYLANITEIFKIWNGGLAIHGGIIASLVFIYIYCRREKLNFLLMLDIIVVGVIIAQAIGRWGNFMNNEAFGRITTLRYLENLHLPQFIIDGMYINGYYREPTFLYESVLSFIGFCCLIILRKMKKLKVGFLTSAYLIWYGLVRFFIESLRSDSLMLGNIKVAQLISILFVATGIYLLVYSTRKNKIYSKESF